MDKGTTNPFEVATYGIFTPVIYATTFAGAGYPFIGLLVFAAFAIPAYRWGVLKTLNSWPLTTKLSLYLGPFVFVGGWVLANFLNHVWYAGFLIFGYAVVAAIGYWQGNKAFKGLPHER